MQDRDRATFATRFFAAGPWPWLAAAIYDGAMKGTTFRISHPHWKTAVVEEGGGRVVLISATSQPHMVLSSQGRAETLLGAKLSDFHAPQPGGRATDQNAWSRQQTFRDIHRIEAISDRAYGHDGVLYERQEQDVRDRRSAAERETEDERRAQREAADKARREAEDRALVERAEAARRRLGPDSDTVPPAE